MLVDLPHEAVVQYQASLELLDAIGDAFWVGGMFNIQNIVIKELYILTGTETRHLCL